MNLPEEPINQLINRALEEDVKEGDVTTNAIFGPKERTRAVWTAKQAGTVAGLEIALQVFKKMDDDIDWQPKVKEGQAVKNGQELLVVEGKTRALLTAERLALNFAQRLSGIATQTAQFVEAIKGLETKIYDTRKTVPGFRALDKYAVRMGGGCNHRMGLYDMALIKDNHIEAAGGIRQAVEAVRHYDSDLTIEVETATLEHVREALDARADIIMLDNMSFQKMKEAVNIIDNQARTEASGNITMQTVRDVAQTGVDAISVGALTHSVQAFDISQTLHT